MKTSTIVLIVVGLAVVGVGAYFMFFRKKSAPAPVPMAKPASAQSTGQQVLGFAENEGKKALGGLLNGLFGGN